MKLAEAILDGVFPPTCLGCSQEGIWLCARCLDTIPFVGEAMVSEESPLCGLVAVSRYQDPLVGALIRSLKYQRALCLEEEALRSILRRFATEVDFLSLLQTPPTMIVPLAMDPERERIRGIDHALRITRLVQSVLFPDVPIVQALARAKSVQPNAQLGTAEARKANLQGVFVCAKDVFAESVLLVDDVYTTGATLSEGAKLLLAHGAERVQGCVLAQSGG